MLKNLLFLSILALFSCINSTKKNKTQKQMSLQKEEILDDCKNLNLYEFKGEFIDLETMQKIAIERLPAEHFKVCSRYAHRFENPLKDTLIVEGRVFTILNREETEEYKLNIFENQELIKSIQLPVEQPLAEVHEYSFWMLQFENSVIVMMDNFYSTYYRIVKYDIKGNELMQTDIEHTYVTHPEANTDYHHPYLSYAGITKIEMVFSSHNFYAKKFKTVFLNLKNFETEEYEQTSNGLILDKKEEKVLGFITYEKNIYKVSMLDGTKYNFNLPYGEPACDLLLKDNLLYIANYHPIATGSSLHCFDMEKGEIKWTADVLQVFAAHSEYENQVTLSFYKDKLIMEGNESYGDYLQIFDPESGERLAEFGTFLKIDDY